MRQATPQPCQEASCALANIAVFQPRLAVVLLALLPWVASGQQQLLEATAETDNIRVEFMGASGGMKVLNLDNLDSFLMVQQDELLEVDNSGEMVVPPNRMSMAGGDAQWSALTTQEDGGIAIYSTSFTKTDGTKSFTLTAHVTRTTIETTEIVACSGCADGTEGVCIDESTSICTALVEGPPSVCAVGSTSCTEPIKLQSDTLKFSIVVSGWDFALPTNKLTYAMQLKHGGEATPEVARSTTGVDIVVPGTGWLQIPTAGVIVGGAARVPIEVAVSTRTQGSQFILDYQFPHFAAGTSLYYDPTFSTVGFSSAGLSTPAAIAVGLASATALAIGMMVVRVKYRSLHPKRSLTTDSWKNRLHETIPTAISTTLKAGGYTKVQTTSTP